MEKRLEFYRMVYKRTRLVRFLDYLGVFAVIISVAAYVATLVLSAYYNIWFMLKYLAVTALSFGAVSLFRYLLNTDRPYQLLDFSDFTDRMKGKKAGRSFPSRHVFSAFTVGSTLCFMSLPMWPIGIAVLFLGAALAVCRVVLGVHFIRDVVGGAAVGTLCGSIGMVIILFL